MESKFNGGLLGLIGIEFLMVIIIVFTFGICTPWAICIKEKWYAKHTIIDGKQLYFDGNAMQLFGNWIKWLLLTIITFGIYSFWLSIKMKQWIIKHTHEEGYVSNTAQIQQTIQINQNFIPNETNNQTNFTNTTNETETIESNTNQNNNNNDWL